MSAGHDKVDYRALLKEAFLSIEKLQAKIDSLERERREPIAVVGLACRLPGEADSAEGFWRLLREGVDAIGDVPADRWDVDAYFDPDPDAPGKMYTKQGGFLSSVDRFEPQFFGISPRESASMDPQQRLLLEVAWEALEDAAIEPDTLVGSRTGVFIGISTGDYAQLLAEGADATSDLYAGTGNSYSVASGRLAYVLGLQGPCMSVDTACSSSLVSVHLAIDSLRKGESSLALAGGVNLMLSPEPTVLTCKGRMLSADGRCKTFDASANGYVRAEGCGLVVLKRLSDARKAGDRVLAVLRGSAVNQDGRSTGLTAPNGTAQERLLRAALENAQVVPADVDYVEAHGTGTPLGDPIEMRALTAVMGEGRPPERPLLVGSVKTNLGHLEAAAGIASLIKVILSLHHGAIPAHLNLSRPTAQIPWTEIPVRVPRTLEPWPVVGRRRIAGVSSFGFSGTNAHVIVEQAPEEPVQPATVDRPLHILTVSARSEAALDALMDRYVARLEASPHEALANVAFTAASGRTHFRHRLAVIAETTEKAIGSLRSARTGRGSLRVRRADEGSGRVEKTALLFTGQGAQHVGMGAALYRTLPAFRAAFDRCDALFGSHGCGQLTDLLYGDADPHEREAALKETQFTQPALFALEYALAQVWLGWGLKPKAVVGHSLGEYTAACVAGVMSLEDAVALVAGRSRLMQALPAGGRMASVLGGERLMREVIAPLSSTVSLAAVNGPESCVISGAASDVETVVRMLSARGIRSTPLAVSHAFHSPLMTPILDDFERIAARISFRPPRIRLLSNVTGGPVDPGELTPAYWRRHLAQTVMFAPSIEWLDQQGFRIFLEIGPHTTLIGQAAACAPSRDALWLPSLRKGRNEWEQMLDSLAQIYVAGADVDWGAFDRGYARRKVSMPTYPFQRERYWIPAWPRQRHTRPGQEPVGSAQPASVERESNADLYVVEWQAQELEARERPARGVWLLCADETGIAHSLGRALTEAGHNVLFVRTGAEFSRSPDGFLVDPANPSHFQRLLSELPSDSHVCGIVHMWSLDNAGTEPVLHAFEERQSRRCGSLLHLTQALTLRSGLAPRLWVVTSGAQPAAADSDVRPVQASVWGLARVIAREHPALACSAIDLDPREWQQNIRQLVMELEANGREDQIAFHGGNRTVARLGRVRSEAIEAARASAGGERPLIPIRPDATYLITGGCGALGQHVCRWLVDRGATRIVLTGRSAPPPHVLRTIDAYRGSHGLDVLIERGDVCDEDDLARILAVCDIADRPLRGVFHAAGVVDDALLGDQSWARFQAVLAPKVRGGSLLHALTSSCELDLFVLFSSAAALFGTPGQASYAAANAFLDSLAAFRRGQGQPALSVNWGPWSSGGMAARLDERERRRLLGSGMHALEPDAAVRLLEGLFAAGITAGAAMRVDWPKLLQAYPQGRVPAILEEFVVQSETAMPPVGPTAVRLRLETAGEAERADLAAALLTSSAAAVLGLEPDAVDPQMPLTSLGLDSLMAVELKNRVEAAIAIQLPLRPFLDGSSTEQLAREIVAAFNATITVRGAAEADEQNDWLERVQELSDDKVDELLEVMLGEELAPGQAASGRPPGVSNRPDAKGDA